MDRLPSELIPAITKHLDYRYHYQVALIWCYLYLNYDAPFGPFCDRIAFSPNAVGSHVRVLDTSFEWTDVTMLALIKHLPHLDTLKIMNGQGITDDSFQWLGPSCPQLTTLHLRDSPITQTTMVSLGQHCKHLKYLTLGECPHLGSDLFSALVDCPLEEIDIQECHLGGADTDAWREQPATEQQQQEQERIDAAHKQGMVDLLKLRTLKKLRFSQTHSFPFHLSPEYDPTTVWPHLTSLNLDTAQSLDEPHAIAFLKTHPALTDVSLDGSHLSDAFLDAIITYARHTIDALGLHDQPRITAPAIRRLILACPQLGVVTMYDCGIVGRDFPETEPFSLYEGEEFDREPITSLWGDTMDTIRKKAQGNPSHQ
ncbi:hypothetical protein BCR42DRAFT_421324 [Absidia repens]|uniref:F-box domain-containing protein n=1 Tax=Absidia repens TaxID=90262 RepID=A0A1X2I8D5_9FUNG|nr:hypothetical protein BCR42DRAFT_421324 [Absidia repens]